MSFKSFLMTREELTSNFMSLVKANEELIKERNKLRLALSRTIDLIHSLTDEDEMYDAQDLIEEGKLDEFHELLAQTKNNEWFSDE